jgi:HAD superfamily hydrolase (TIGR01509 family)
MARARLSVDPGDRRPVLLFDVMSTLVYDPFYVEMPAFFGMSLKQLIACKSPTAWLRFETGEIDEDTFHSIFFDDERDYDHEGLRSCAKNGYRWLDGMRALTGELKDAGYSLHALSNYPPWFRLIEERLELSKTVAWSFVSCDMGVRKPDPEAFLIPTRALGVEPRECLFIDDQQRNCDAAVEVGMDAIKFEDAGALRSALVTRGLPADR